MWESGKEGSCLKSEQKEKSKNVQFVVCYFLFCFVFFLSLFFLIMLLSTFPLVPNTLPGNIRERTHAHRLSVGEKIPEKKSKIDLFSFCMLLPSNRARISCQPLLTTIVHACSNSCVIRCTCSKKEAIVADSLHIFFV